MQLIINNLLAAREHPSDYSNSTNCFSGNTLYTSLRAVVGVTCGLSMVGSVLIILSYVLIRDIRTRAREILVNLSLMDFVAASANFAGVLINFKHFTGDAVSSHKHYCLTQASFAMYATISSVLWTICIAVYLFIRIMIDNKKIVNRTVNIFYIIAYGLPLIMTVWFLKTGKLGSDPYGGSGWCSLLVDHNGHRLPFNAVFGNDIWIYMTIFLVPVILLSLHFYFKNEVSVVK